MDFKHLREVKEFVNTWNKVHKNLQLEFWFPGMYADGKWGCTIVGNEVMDKSYVMEIVPFLYGLRCSWFIGTCNGDLAFFLQ